MNSFVLYYSILILSIINIIHGKSIIEQNHRFTLTEDITIDTIKKWDSYEKVLYCNDNLKCRNVNEVCMYHTCVYPDFICREKLNNSICFINKNSESYNLTFSNEIKTSCFKNEDCITDLCTDNQCQINNDFSYFYCSKDDEYNYKCNSVNINNTTMEIEKHPYGTVSGYVVCSDEENKKFYISIALYICSLPLIMVISVCGCSKLVFNPNNEELQKNEIEVDYCAQNCCKICLAIFLIFVATIFFVYSIPTCNFGYR